MNANNFSNIRLPYPAGINPLCVAGYEYQERGVWYRAEAYPYQNQAGEQLVYTGYRDCGGSFEKVPCFTRSESSKYPKTLAVVGSALVAACNNSKPAALAA